MLAFLNESSRASKRRLLSAACCRRFWDLLTDERSRSAVAVAERYADGIASRHELLAAQQAAKAAGPPIIDGDFRSPERQAAAAGAVAASDPVLDKALRALAWLKGVRLAQGYRRQIESGLFDEGRSSSAIMYQASTEWGKESATLLRELFAGPARGGQGLDSSSLTQNALALAREMYDSGTFNRMPALADALQAAGCTDDDILRHCRAQIAHVRGCWVLDLILNRE